MRRGEQARRRPADPGTWRSGRWRCSYTKWSSWNTPEWTVRKDSVYMLRWPVSVAACVHHMTIALRLPKPFAPPARSSRKVAVDSRECRDLGDARASQSQSWRARLRSTCRQVIVRAGPGARSPASSRPPCASRHRWRTSVRRGRAGSLALSSDGLRPVPIAEGSGARRTGRLRDRRRRAAPSRLARSAAPRRRMLMVMATQARGPSHINEGLTPTARLRCSGSGRSSSCRR